MESIRKRKLTNAALIVMSSIVVSRITGFFRELLIPNVLTPAEADAYIMAFKITDLMYNLLVGGAIAAALIPVLTGYIENDDEEEGWKAIGTFINVVFIVMSFLCLLGMVFAPWIIPVIARGFRGESTELTIRLARILFPSVSFIMLAGLTNGVLNSYNRFAASAYGPSIYNIGGALSLLFLNRYGVEAIAFGVMCSAIIYFLFQLSFAYKNLKNYRFKIYLKHPGFEKLVRLAIPSLLSSSIVQINVIISAMFVTLFGEGSINAFNMADKTWQMPYGIFAQGIGIAMLPALSAKFATGEIGEYKTILNKSLKSVLLFSIPSAVGLVALREPVIKAIFQWSENFDKGYIQTAGDILMFFSIALLTHSVTAIMNRAFYAVNDTKSPLFVGISTIVVNLGMSFMLYRYTNLGVAGMALSYSITSALNALLLMLILNKKLGGIYLDRFLIFLFKAIPASLIMGLALLLMNRVIDYNSISKAAQLVYIIAEIAFGAVLYLGLTLLFKIEEVQNGCKAFCRKIKFINNKSSFNP